MKTLFALFTFASTLLSAETRVYVDAVGDLMHAGHIEMFKRARAEGDYLIVGVHNDEDVAGYKRWPILTMQERITVIEACRYVDEVIPNAPLLLTEEYIQKHNINLVIHGDDISEETKQIWYAAPLKLGIFKTLSYTNGISTTNIIDRVLNNYCDTSCAPN